jgi:hypothetical protein
MTGLGALLLSSHQIHKIYCLQEEEEEEVTELQCYRTFKIKFNEVPPDVFWISIRKEYL